jgi:putative membrane protein
LIFASGLLVALMIHVQARWELVRVVLCGIAGAAFAWWIAGLDTTSAADPHLAYIFFCATVAICAMILPGISGAMILLILGVYVHLTEIPGNILRGRDLAQGIVTVVVFATGCAVGLITFSKILRWLLARYHAVTMAVLCGFMFGSLRKLWPFQRDLTPEIEKIKFKTFRPILPDRVDGHVLAVVLVVCLAGGLVLVVDWHTHRYLHRLFRRRDAGTTDSQ